ncbi:toxin TumE [Desulfonema magnum]|uniref:Uncharacterized protein n=1 Tax=Desulfonema magnum TaxID=45655 RepID=A0A975GRE9_9BACT|nr:DUF6516 family protein [Desulfonema magnum]QTA90825.1 Uncharacterized protein dnm_068870 [Desulfonema magnum]
MPHDMISHYLSQIESAIRGLRDAYTERYKEEILGYDRANLRIRIRFLSGYLLELNEAIILKAGQIKYLDYRYHFQDRENNLVFRYDNTPHFPNIDSFPHHKHLKSEVIPSDKPSILKVIEEVSMQVY